MELLCDDVLLVVAIVAGEEDKDFCDVDIGCGFGCGNCVCEGEDNVGVLVDCCIELPATVSLPEDLPVLRLLDIRAI